MHPGLLSDILEHPDQDDLRLIYADWLEDHGQEERAAFIRVQIELSRLLRDSDHDNVVHPECSCRFCVLNRLEFALRTTMLNTSTPTQRSSANTVYLWAMREGLGRHVHVWPHCWRRGFIEAVTLPCAAWLDHGPELVRCQPIQRVRLSDHEPDPMRRPPFRWRWWSMVVNPHTAHEGTRLFLGTAILPVPLFDHLQGGTRLTRWVVYYDTKDQALTDLSDACLLFAKQQQPAPQEALT